MKPSQRKTRLRSLHPLIEPRLQNEKKKKKGLLMTQRCDEDEEMLNFCVSANCLNRPMLFVLLYMRTCENTSFPGGNDAGLDSSGGREVNLVGLGRSDVKSKCCWLKSSPCRDVGSPDQCVGHAGVAKSVSITSALTFICDFAKLQEKSEYSHLSLIPGFVILQYLQELKCITMDITQCFNLETSIHSFTNRINI